MKPFLVLWAFWLAAGRQVLHLYLPAVRHWGVCDLGGRSTRRRLRRGRNAARPAETEAATSAVQQHGLGTEKKENVSRKKTEKGSGLQRWRSCWLVRLHHEQQPWRKARKFRFNLNHNLKGPCVHHQHE